MADQHKRETTSSAQRDQSPGEGANPFLTSEGHSDRKYVAGLTGCGVALVFIFAAITLVWMSDKDTSRNEVLWIVGLYWLASIVWLAAMFCGLWVQKSKRGILPIIIAFAVCFRAVQMFGTPILELDVYRYMWDGIVSSHGSSPYECSPQAILADEITIADPQLARVADIASMSPSHQAILLKVHYPEYTTIYPPVSQAVFAAAMWAVPDRATVSTHLFVMRLVLLAFDLATLFVVIGLLRLTQSHIGWAIAYAWNPLVIKEVANSAHVDTIAACFTSLALLVVLQGLRAGSWRASYWRAGASAAALLAMGVGAKLYPVVLAPIIFLLLAKSSLRAAMLFASVFVVASSLLLVWMIPMSHPESSRTATESVSVVSRQRNGLAGFLSQWRMNSLLFNICYENAIVRDEKQETGKNHIWYSVFPNDWRRRLHRIAGIHETGGDAAFRLARITTLGLFLIVAGALAFRLWQSPCDPSSTLNITFLLLASFLLLQPTVNPWYCLWTTPFVCFARNRGWLLFGPILLMYYLRFWLRATDVGFSFGSLSYRGVAVFDHCIVWVEYAAIAFSLILIGVVARRNVYSKLADVKVV